MIHKFNIVGIIQVRMNSKRLPGKAMMKLNGIPIVEFIYKRVNKSKKLNKIVFATTDNKFDDKLYNFLLKLGANVFRGSEFDLLDRYYNAAKKYKSTHLVRICADNPFVSSEEIDNLIDFYLKNNFDYVYNHEPINNTYPDGFGGEMTSFEILSFVKSRAKIKDHREHLFNYLWDNQFDFKIGTLNPKNKAIQKPNLRFDINSFEDYQRLNKLNIDPNDSLEKIIYKATKLNIL